MPYDEDLAKRTRAAISKLAPVEEKKMFGGLCFLVRGHMTCGTARSDLVVRVGPDAYDDALKQPGARPMDITGRPLKGLVYVNSKVAADNRSLARWVKRAVTFVETLPPKKKTAKKAPSKKKAATKKKRAPVAKKATKKTVAKKKRSTRAPQKKSTAKKAFPAKKRRARAAPKKPTRRRKR